jgi:DNA-directed RNA polymerase subunit alpha
VETTIDTPELSTFFQQAELTGADYERFADLVHTTVLVRDKFERRAREVQEQGEADPLRRAQAWLILGEFDRALENLEQAPAGAARQFYTARAHAGTGDTDAALAAYAEAAKAGWDAFETDMERAMLHVRRDEIDAAETLVAKHESAGADRAQWYYLKGLLAEQHADHDAAFEAYDKALTLDPEHARTLFRAARLSDLWGEDERALELYNRLAEQPRTHVNALLNAAVIYEDVGRYEEAARCLRRVLRTDPSHARARLFLLDVESSREMVIDEVGEDRQDARSRLLDTPLSEFELSVRARNCLKKMNVRSLGELIRLTEAELLAYKNFGETSLNEIKALLAKKNLRLGQSPEEINFEAVEQATESPAAAAAVPPGQEAVLSKSVSELELSVRARRCLQRLNVQSLGDLIQFSESDLLATRNFGVTSLNEIKSRLIEFNLQLAPKKSG